MKKFISILLLMLYTIATSGAIVKMHYCGEMLESWKITLQSEIATGSGCCETTEDSCVTSEEEEQCCSDDIIALKIGNDYNYYNYKIELPGYTAFVLPEMPYPSYSWRLQEFLNEKTTAYSPTTTNKGLWQNIPLYILFDNRKIFDLHTI